MKLSQLDWFLWIAYFFGEITLLSTLLYRRRWKEFPVFTTIIGAESLINIALYVAHADGSSVWYSRIYYGYNLPYFVLQLGMIWEIARIVMRPTGTWVRDARRQFILWSVTGILTAVALSWLLTRSGADLLERLAVWSDLFLDLVFCELLVVMLLIAKRLGLGFRNHVFSLVLGWSIVAIGELPIDTWRGYYGTHFYFDILSNIGQFAFLSALVYWIIQFWVEEPARRPISPELSAYIENLHRHVEKNLDMMDAQR